MGNTESTSFIGKNVNPSEYQLVGKVHSVRWGELFEMNHIRARKLVFMQEKHSKNVEHHQKLARLCAQRMTLAHRNLAVIYGAASNNTPDVFTNTYKACIFFEHLPQSLQTLIDNKTYHYNKQTNFRQSTRLPDYFENAQILSLIHELVNGFSYLQKNGICQGDITPDVCFISEDGTPKVLEKSFLFHNDSAIDTAMRSNFCVFLTPAELETIANQDVPLTEDQFKADVFRLGLTILECATLKKSSQIYNWDDYVIDMDILSSRLAEVQDRYSPEVYEKLREMLRLEERRRPDFISLAQTGQPGQPSQHGQRPTPNPRDYVSSKSMGQLNRPNKEPLAKSMTTIGIGPKLTAHVPMQTDKYPKSTSNTDKRGGYNQNQNQGYPVQRQTKGNASRRENLRDEDIEEFDDTARINRVPHIDPYNASFDNSKDRSLNASSIMQHRDSIRQDEYDDEDDGSQTTVKSLSLSRPSVKHNNSMEREKFSFQNNFHTASPQRGQQNNPPGGFDLQQWKQTNSQSQNNLMMRSPQNSSQNRQRNSIFTQATGRSDFQHPQLIDLHNLPQPSKNTRSTSQTPTAKSQKPNNNVYSSQRTTPPRVQNQKPSHISLSKLNNWESTPAQGNDDYSPRFPTQQKNPSLKAPNEKDLVESILRNVMTSAGISPVKQPQKSSIAYTEDHDAERNFQRPQEADQQNYQPQAFSRSYYSSKTPSAKTNSYLQRPDLSGGHQKYSSDNKPSSGFVNTYQSHKSQPGANYMSSPYQSRTNTHTREPSNAVETGRMTASSKEAATPEGNGYVNVDNRFEMAMQRSQRSVGYMKNLARHMESERSLSTGPGGSAQKRFRQDDY